MGINIKPQKFHVKVKGEITGEEYAGEFKAMPVLPHGLQMEQDKLRRQYLGEKPEYATPRAINQAQVFAELHSHIVEAPKWWSEAKDGMALFDDNVVRAVSDGVNKVQNDFAAELKKQQTDAQADLKKAEEPTP